MSSHEPMGTGVTVPPSVHVLVGLHGSGKTTKASELETQLPAVRFTLDQWMRRLFPKLRFDEPEYGARVEVVRELIWAITVQVLATGRDAVFDWNHWSRERRARSADVARSAGADVVVHWMATDRSECDRRLRLRAAANDPDAHPVTALDNEHMATLLEPPSLDEGLRIVESR